MGYNTLLRVIHKFLNGPTTHLLGVLLEVCCASTLKLLYDVGYLLYIGTTKENGLFSTRELFKFNCELCFMIRVFEIFLLKKNYFGINGLYFSKRESAQNNDLFARPSQKDGERVSMWRTSSIQFCLLRKIKEEKHYDDVLRFFSCASFALPSSSPSAHDRFCSRILPPCKNQAFVMLMNRVVTIKVLCDLSQAMFAIEALFMCYSALLCTRLQS